MNVDLWIANKIHAIFMGSQRYKKKEKKMLREQKKAQLKMN